MNCNVQGHGDSGELEQLLHDDGEATHKIEFTCPACGEFGIDKHSCGTYASFLAESLDEKDDTRFPCQHCYLFLYAYEYRISIRRL